MCGISGFNWKNESKIVSMMQTLSHRGPDANGIFVDEKISLGHNRLSIIDLSISANQPMYDNTGELVIVFNGEIYNFKELKRELEEEYEFKTKSDTEVILAGYRKWGKDVVNKLNGMFAFAIWDKRDKSLFCARDHAGIKPFYYFWNGKKLIFASELRAILTHNVPRDLNKDAFNHYLRILYVPEPMTMVKDVYKLAPSHTLLFKNGSISIEEYGVDSIEPFNLTYPETVKAVREKVIKSVGRHLVSDVPVGLYLSGGIDSSIVLYSMSKFRKGIKTFSIGFDLEDKGEQVKFNHDFELARQTASFFGSEHHSFRVSASDVISTLEDVAIHNSDPISHPTAVAMLLFAKFAKQEVSVVLNGSGGDELFGGYERYRLVLAASYYKKLPKIVRKVGNMYSKIAKLEYGNTSDLFAKFMFQKDEKLLSVISPSILKADTLIKTHFQDHYLSKCGTNDPVTCLMDTDRQSWLPEYFFMLSDGMSMASALEERVPLMDKELVSLARSMPRSYKIDLFGTKKVLKDAFKDDLPDFLFRQPKRGWFAPGAKWFRDPEFSKFAREVLSEEYYEGTRALFNWPGVEEMLNKHISKEKYNLISLWAILTFQIWARKYQIKI